LNIKLFLAMRSDLDQLGIDPQRPVVTIRAMPIAHWTPDTAEHWVVVGVDPGGEVGRDETAEVSEI
jgi:hypothetical protein